MNILSQLIARLKLQLRGKNHIVGWNMKPDKAVSFIRGRGKTVLTFFGYSGVGYRNVRGMLKIAQAILSTYSPQTTLVNIGVTKVGIGAVYPLAKSMGFETTGVVTSLAVKYRGGISESVDHICFIKDTQWGGKLPNSDELSPTSRAMVDCSDILVVIGRGGGEGIVAAEMLEGQVQGKPIHYFPAEMKIKYFPY